MRGWVEAAEKRLQGVVEERIGVAQEAMRSTVAGEVGEVMRQHEAMQRQVARIGERVGVGVSWSGGGARARAMSLAR